MEENQDELLKELKEISLVYRDLNKKSKEIDKELDERKIKIKDILQKLNTNQFKDDEIKITLSTYDKSYLDEGSTIKYLKNNGLEKYVKQKEYFEPEELIVAANNGELNIEDLAKFKVEKFETRLTIKKKKIICIKYYILCII